MDIVLWEVNNFDKYIEAMFTVIPDIVIVNYHHATLPFIQDESMVKGIRYAAIFHEGPLNFTPDIVLNTEIRPLFNIDLPVWRNEIPTIGSFGFGFPDKDFTRVCREVMNQYDKAIVRLLIPFAYYGDRDGALAKDQARRCAELLKGTNIRLDVLHEYLPPLSLLHWLNQNDLNLFLYKPSHGRGIASATDYALSVNKPIGVSNSEMFRHLPKEIYIDNTPLKELTVEMLKETKERNSNEKLVEYYKTMLL